MKRKNRDSQWRFRILLTCAAALFLLPAWLNAWTKIGQLKAFARYEETESVDTAGKKRDLEAARKYNRQLFLQQQDRQMAEENGNVIVEGNYPGRMGNGTETTIYQGNGEDDEEYQNLLRSGGPEDVMAWLRIPDIDLHISVCHGTSEEHLRYEAGHVYGTSLPVGGEDTHAVIAAHSGLMHAELFSNISELQEGDPFFLMAQGKTLAYRVDQIRTVLPEEEAAFLRIIPGGDYVTLYTCTPPGINDHRLLVRGVRDPEMERRLREKNLLDTLRDTKQKIREEFAKLIAVPAVVAAFHGLVREKERRREEGRKKCRGERRG